MLELNSVYEGDCLEIMHYIPDSTIDMVLTSPPYDNLRTYNESLDWGEHVWKPVIKTLFRIVKDGGVCVWIVGDATIKGDETGTSFRQALYFKKAGFNLHDTMIWNKGNFTAVGALRTSYAPVFDYMFVLTKGKIKTFNPIKDRKNKSFGEVFHNSIRQKDGSIRDGCGKGLKTIAEFGQRHNIWEIPPEKDNNKRLHPAIFPEKLVHDHIISWSNEGDIILDPFAGSGTVGKMAKRLNRKYILLEKEPEYIEIIKKNMRNCVGDK